MNSEVRKADLHKNIVSAVDRAIGHCSETGYDDIFKPAFFHEPVEALLVKRDKDFFARDFRNLAIKFLKADVSNCGYIGKPKEYFAPKDNLNFRRVSWFEPLDAVKFLSLSLVAFDKFLEVRPSGGVIFSHQLDFSKNNFFRDSQFEKFKRKAAEKRKEYSDGFQLNADISNFFDRVSIHQLENIMYDIGVPEAIIKKIDNNLKFFASQQSFGLPVGGDASRLLSEISLFRVDRELLKEGIDFIRFVDDFRIFCRKKSELFSTLHILTRALAREGLFLNHSKTFWIECHNSEEERQDNNVLAGGIEHEKIDIDRKEEIIVRSAISGRTSISKRYIKPGEKAIAFLKKQSAEKLLENFITSNGRDKERYLRDLVKYILYISFSKDYLFYLLEQEQSALFYISDALSKDGSRVPKEERQSLSEGIRSRIDFDKSPPPYQLAYIKILSTDEFIDQEFLRNFILKLPLLGSIIFARESLLFSLKHTDQLTIREFAEGNYHSFSSDIRRVIIYSIIKSNCFHPSAKQALLNNLTSNEEDVFIKKMVDSPDILLS